MSCFNHHEVSAVCSCKSCSRFMCPECAIAIEYGFVCSESCRANVEAIEQYNQATLQERQDAVRVNEVAVRNLANAKKTYRSFIGFYLLMALMTLASGIDRADYSYAVTFIAIFTLLITYSALRIRSINRFLDELSSHGRHAENMGH